MCHTERIIVQSIVATLCCFQGTFSLEASQMLLLTDSETVQYLALLSLGDLVHFSLFGYIIDFIFYSLHYGLLVTIELILVRIYLGP